jgi:hypothetical protein
MAGVTKQNAQNAQRANEYTQIANQLLQKIPPNSSMPPFIKSRTAPVW